MLEFIEQIAKIGALVAAGTVLVAVIGAWSYARFFRRSAQTLLFMRYTERYEQIMSSFPEEALQFRFNLASELPKPSAPLTLAVLKYLNLCAEEYHLFSKGFIERAVWEIWEVELRRHLASELVKREWKLLRPEFESYPVFQQYVESLQQPTATRPLNVPVL